MEKRTRTILVPIDSNDQTIIALSQSYNLARLTKSKIVLLSIDDGNASENIETKLEELAKEASEATGRKAETMIRKGDVYEEIEKVADELRPAFIMLGITKGEDGFGGKNALEMVRKSKHAIISVGGREHRDNCSKILMPLDLSVLSREKLARTVEVAKLFHSSISIISVLNKESKLEENKLHMYANQCIKFIKEKNGLEASAKFIRSKEDMAEVVIQYGKEIEADLIVIISDKDRSVKEVFTGTAAQRLINNSDIPVLTLRPMERRDMTQAIF